MGRHVRQAVHACPESAKTQFVVWSLKPGPYIFLDIVCFVKWTFIWFIGMAKLGVKEGLGEITGTFKAFVETIEAHQDLTL